jgi:hypothetical protein
MPNSVQSSTPNNLQSDKIAVGCMPLMIVCDKRHIHTRLKSPNVWKNLQTQASELVRLSASACIFDPIERASNFVGKRVGVPLELREIPALRLGQTGGCLDPDALLLSRQACPNAVVGEHAILLQGRTCFSSRPETHGQVANPLSVVEIA